MPFHHPLTLLLFAFSVGCDRTASGERLGVSACSDTVREVVYTLDEITRAPVHTYALGTRVGAVEGAPGTAWGRIADAAVDRSGNIYVADAMEKRIFVHHVRSGRMRSIGGPGRGPSEFEYLMVLEIVGDSVLMVFDPLLWRVSTFDTLGMNISVATPPPDPQMGQVWESRFTAAGRLVNLSYRKYEQSLMDELSGRREGVLRGVTVLQAWGPDGEWTPIVEIPGPEVFVKLDQGEIQDVPFAKRPLWDVGSGDDIWYADNAQYVVDRIGLDGHRACTIDVRVEPPPVTDSDVTSYRSARDVADPERRRVVAERRKSTPIPSDRPALSHLVSAWDGGVWVKPSVPSRSDDQTGELDEWHVWSSDGRLSHVALVPNGFIPLAITPAHVVGVRKDQSDIEYLDVLHED